VTTATIHSLRSDHQDMHAIIILMKLFLKKISSETQKIVADLYVLLFPSQTAFLSQDAKNPAATLNP
jgi:hypothetical protein